MPVVVLPEDPADEWDIDEWREQARGASGAHSHQASEENLMVRVPENQVRSFLQQALGWAWADDEDPYLIHRENVALQHPKYPWLWCDGVGNSPYNPLGALQLDGTRKAKREGVGWEGYAPAGTVNYGSTDITLRFKNIWWRQFHDFDPIWQDHYVGKEWMRSLANVNKSVQLDLIAAEGANDNASLFWAEGNPTTGPVAGPNPGSAFNGTQFVRAQRTTFRLTWKCVPLNYTCGQIDFNQDDIASFLMPYPERLVKALGCVNSTPFPGENSPYVPGTLLFTAFEEIPYQLPVRTDSEFGLLAADYALTFEQFDPERDPAAVARYSSGSVVASGDLKRGHHLYPYRPSGRYWYYATSGADNVKGTYSGNPVLREVDFHNLFRHRSDTAYSIP